MHGRPAPLDGVRVIELADGAGEMCGRILAELGADVIKIEPPPGAPSPTEPPLHAGVGVAFAVRNAGKRSVVADLSGADGRDRLLGLLAGAGIWVVSGPAWLDHDSVR